MVKKYYTILFLFILSGIFILIQPAEAGVVWFLGKDISVDFDGLPFNLSNWAPGMSDAKNITIKNNESFDIDVYFKAKEISGDNILANALTITVDNQSKHLSDLFDNNLFLGSVDSKKLQNYDISITFDSDAGNEYQNKVINFDFIITVAQINGGGGGQIVIPGGGSGGSLPSRLSIYNEAEGVVATTSVTITWKTNYDSTSQVIYSLENEPHNFNLYNPPAGTYYGYAHAAPLPEDTDMVRTHIVTIAELTPGTTYYYRVVSHASPPTISKEHSFTTLASAPISPSPTPPSPAPGPISGPTSALSPELGPGSESTIETIPSPGETPSAPILPTVPDTEIGDIGFGANMLAAIGDIMDSKFLFAISIILLILLIILLIRESRMRYLSIKRKRIIRGIEKKKFHNF